MRLSSTSILWIIVLPASAMGRTITVKNACPFTIWPALFTAPNLGPIPSQPTGWEAPSNSEVSFTVADNWTAGRIWGRRNCDFSVNPGPNSCLDGGCNGGLVCTATGVPPATLAEFTLRATDGLDYYDVSVVDGYNLPMAITNTGGCNIASCPVDLGPNCPDALKGPFDSSGFAVGCKSACDAQFSGDDPNNSPNCCTGSHNTAGTCPPSGVQYYDYFKSNCPLSYVYAYDESSGTALWTCASSANSDYTVTFCP